MKLCVFDRSRGQQEGEEADKILFFFPPDVPLNEQVALVGLWEGLLAFSSVFAGQDWPCELMEGQRQQHIFLQCDGPCIFIVLVVDDAQDRPGKPLKAVLGSPAPKKDHMNGVSGGAGGPGNTTPEQRQAPRHAALRRFMKEAYHQFCLFYGPLPQLIHTIGVRTARRCLVSFFPDYLTDGLASSATKSSPSSSALMRAAAKRIPGLQDNLTEPSTVQPLQPCDSHTMLEALVQSLLSLFSCHGMPGGPGDVEDEQPTPVAMLLFKEELVATTLPPVESAALYAYARARLVPAAAVPATSSLFSRPSSPFSFRPQGAQPLKGHPRKLKFLAPPGTALSTHPQEMTSARGAKGPSEAIAGSCASPSSRAPASMHPSNRQAQHVPAHSLRFPPFPLSAPPKPFSSPAWTRDSDGVSLTTEAWGKDEAGWLVEPTIQVGWGAQAAAAEERQGQGCSLADALVEAGADQGLAEGRDGDSAGDGEEETAVWGSSRRSSKSMLLRACHCGSLTLVLGYPTPLLHHSGHSSSTTPGLSSSGGPTLQGSTAETLQRLWASLQELQRRIESQHEGPLHTHIKGHRYLSVDTLTGLALATPPVKVTTLRKDSLLLLNQMRAEMDCSLRRAQVLQSTSSRRFTLQKQQRNASEGSCAVASQERPPHNSGDHSEEERQSVLDGIEELGLRNTSATSRGASPAPVSGPGILQGAEGEEWEIYSRIGHNVWAVALSRADGQQLFTVMEKGADALVAAQDNVEELKRRCQWQGSI